MVASGTWSVFTTHLIDIDQIIAYFFRIVGTL